MKDGSLYPIWKEGKAFYFYSDTDKDSYTRGKQGGPYIPVPIGPLTGPGVAVVGVGVGGSTDHPLFHRDKEARIFTIDMDSGNVY
jgi:hypothetical protein